MNKPLKYNIVPVIADERSDLPLTPEPLEAHEIGPILQGRIEQMAAQGFWRDNAGVHVPLTEVRYLIEPAEPCDEDNEDEDE